MDSWFNYIPTPTGLAFHESDAKIKCLVGPYGSGKSTCVAEDIQYYAMSQPPGPDGVRRTVVGVVRATYPELTSATRKTIMEVFPAGFGTINMGGAPVTGLYRFPLQDNTTVQVEFQMIALQTADEAEEKLKSMNWSLAWINEATGVEHGVITAVLGRVGRYIPNGVPCKYKGILIDSNQPPKGHWLDLMEKNPDPGWEFFRQPVAAFKREDEYGKIFYEINKEAENLENLGMDYYTDQIISYKKEGRYDKIDSLFCMLDVPTKDGKPVFQSFNYDLHVAKNIIEPFGYCTTIIGYDTSGIHPAVVIAQEYQGKWAIVDELYGEEMSRDIFLDQALIPLLRTKYATCDFIIACDPADPRDSQTGLTPTAQLNKAGFKVYKPRSNSPTVRISAVEQMLNMNIGGLIISKHCELLINAMQGGYKYRKLKIAGAFESIYNNQPEKNSASHIADALQYLAMYINQGVNKHSDETQKTIRRMSDRRKVLSKII